MRNVWAAGLAAVLASACSTSGQTASVVPDPVVQPAPPPPNASYIPAGTVLTTRLENELSTEDTDVGDTFTVTVVNALVAGNGETVIPAGATITGLVTGIGEKDDHTAVRLNFTRINIDGASHPFSANITSTHALDADRDTDDIVRAAGVGAAAGAVLGAIIGDGDLRDILVGGALGAGAGTIISLGRGDIAHELPAGTHMLLQTTDRVKLR
jgi:hypothetical protein